MEHKSGMVIIGTGGAVGTTKVSGIELLKPGKIETDGLPLAGDIARILDLAKRR